MLSVTAASEHGVVLVTQQVTCHDGRAHVGGLQSAGGGWDGHTPAGPLLPDT